jgi:hypothetical protein
MRERTRRRVAHARASHAQKRQPGARELLLRAPANRDTHTRTHKHTHTHTRRSSWAALQTSLRVGARERDLGQF